MNMENQIWEKTAQFLQDLFCEGIQDCRKIRKLTIIWQISNICEKYYS